MQSDTTKRIWHSRFLGFVAGVGLMCEANAEPLALHVAPNGNDAWSGRLAAPNADATDGPLATLERARDELRQRRRTGGVTDGAALLVRAGEYELTKPFQLTAEDSGTAAAPIVYRAFPGEKPVLFGGKRITDFKPFKDNILQADVAAQGFKGVRFRQLYLNGERQTPARYPSREVRLAVMCSSPPRTPDLLPPRQAPRWRPHHKR